jgi:inner membrane protein
MPSPIGHALAGLIVHTAGSQRRDLQDWPRFGLVVAAACAPDLDLLLRFLIGGQHHRGPSHSLGAALLAGAAAYAMLALAHWPRATRLASLVGLGWASHVLLDWLGSDTHPPLGLMALWPWSSGWYKAPLVFFGDIGRTLELSTVRHNAMAAAWEIVLLLPILLVAARFRQRKS